MHVKISNKVRLAFDMLKTKAFKVMGKSSSTIAHWLYKITRKDEAPKRLGAKSKSRKRK
jgi:hypothetical protein